MNSAYRFLILFALPFLVFNTTAAQKASFETNKGMTIGFGLGAAYQQSDIANSMGGGFDFNLGSYLYKKENAFLSVDWKFRFLTGENMAHDYRMNTDGSFSNIRYEFFNYDLELGFTLNRLRERTRIVISGFAGAGITHGITSTDLLDESGNPYDYSVIDPGLGRKQVYRDLLNLTDGKYETKLINKAAVMPTAGIYLGYQFSRSFSMGIEHKINFSLTENNSFSGINMDNNVVSGSRKDRNHYTSLGFRWILGGRSSGPVPGKNYKVITDPVPVYNPPVTNRPVTISNPVVTVSPPQVEIIVPSANPYTTTGGTLEITARAKNVKGKQDIQVVLNNKNIGFDYNPLYGNIRSTVTLEEGRNILIITGSNEAGSNRADLAIIYNKPLTAVLPQVKIIDPSTSVTVEKNILTIFAQTKNVKAWQDVTVSVNGANFSNFNFSPDGVVNTNIPLKEGINKVQVTGRNEHGSASDLATITYIKPVKAVPPAIKIINPGTNPFSTYEPLQEIKAEITGISGKENITLSLNGINISGFSYNVNSHEMSASATLREGRNTILITARNDAGQDVKTQEIIKETRPCPQPVFKMIQPVQNELPTDEPSFTIRTEIRNIVSREQISVILNNRQITNYNFNDNEIVCVASLVSGINSYVISATNNCGTQKITYSVFFKPKDVIVEKPCPSPGITFSITAINREDATHELKGSVSNVKNRGDIAMTLNDNPFEGFVFNPNTGEIGSAFKFNPGSHTIKVTVKNDCGTDSKTASVSVLEPCVPPRVTFNVAAVNREDATHELKGSVSNVKNRSDIAMTLNDNPFEGFVYNPNTGEIGSAFKFNPGSHTIKVTVKNDCGTDSKTASVSVLEPCVPPRVTFNVAAVNREDATHELKGSVSNVKNRGEIAVTLNDNPFEGFVFDPGTGEIGSAFKFNPGSHTIKVTVKNDCGADSKTASVSVLEPCVPPRVTFNMAAVNREDATHELKGSVSNVKNRGDIAMTLNDNHFEGFVYNPNTGEIGSAFKFNPGSHTIKITVKNDCGTDSKTASVSVLEPCVPPRITYNVAAVNREDATHDLKGSVSNVKNRGDIAMTLNDNPFEGFVYNPNTGEIGSAFKFNPGSHTIKVTVKNDCGTDSKTASVSVLEPCVPPRVTFNMATVNREDATHELKGSVSNVKNRGDIAMTLNDNPFEGFVFDPNTGEIGSALKFNPGSHTIKVTVKNDCGQDTYSVTVVTEEKPCGIRINPGNSSWEFCMVTPSGIIRRDTLTNSNFRYSGPAGSLYFMPIAGGGDAVVKGKAYTIRPGQYYLFTGNLTVTLSTRNPGSMGQWSVCIIADREPLSGNGNNRPLSPCEEQEDDRKAKKER